MNSKEILKALEEQNKTFLFSPKRFVLKNDITDRILIPVLVSQIKKQASEESPDIFMDSYRYTLQSLIEESPELVDQAANINK